MALISAAVTHGYGLHLIEITDPSDREKTLMLTFLAPAVSVVASTLGKISMVLFLVRLLGSSTKKVHLWLLYGVTAIMIGVNIFMIGILLGQCTPMEKSWKPHVDGTCVSLAVWDFGARTQAGTFPAPMTMVNYLLIVGLGWNAFMDLLTAGFPIYMVWSLQLRTSTKWSLSALMAGGLWFVWSIPTDLWCS